jgi:hypothetical protein
MLTGLNLSTASNIQLGAGAILKNKYTAGTVLSADNILSATNGGITVAIVPEYFTPSIDGNFDNVMGTGKTVTRYTATLSFTAVETDAEVLVRALGCADVSGNVITGRHTIKAEDYKDIYAIGERGDGSIIQFTLKNAMNTNGLTLTTANNGNGGIAFSISANYSVDDLDNPPFEIETIVPVGV